MSQRYIGGLIYNPPGGFSGQFGATSTDWIATPSSASFAFGTGDFTLEAFVFATASQTDNWIIGLYNNCWLRVGSGGALEFYNSVGSASIIAGSAMPTNQWVHVAAVRSGTTLTIYQNGTSVASGTVSTNFSTSVACLVGNQGGGFDRRWNGYISNVRVVKGTAVYTAAFTPPNGPLQAITNTSLLTCRYPTFVDGSSNNFTLTVSGSASVNAANPFPLTTLPNPALGNQGNGIYSMSQYQALKQQNLWPAVDPYFDYVTLLLHGNGTNGAQNNTFRDSSTNNFTITRNGNTTQGSISPYGSNWSNYFDGSSLLTFASSTNYVPGSGQFCLECWFFPTSTGDRWLIGNRNGNFVPFGINYAATTYPGTLLFYISSNGSSWDVVNGTTVSGVNANQWNHFALVRNSSNQFIVYINGVGTTIATNAANFASAQPFYVGGSPSAGDADFIGYISNTRFVKGDSVYSGNFTPSTAPLTAITNTQLLTSQSNRFIDNSTNAVTPTLTGAPSAQRFSPFAPTAPYAAGVIGGSAYFDGSGDYLTTPTFGAGNGAGLFTSGATFTVEAWLNQSAFVSTAGYVNTIIGDLTPTTTTSLWWAIGTDASNAPVFRWFDGSVKTCTGANALRLNAWNHVAFVCNAGALSIYLNGVSQSLSGTTTITTPTGTQSNLYVGVDRTNYITGVMTDLRVVKNTAVYTSGFTPPTAPLTAITNTQMLLSYTNGGIVDNAMMSNQETLGNAQISTSVSKFGGGSIAFNGTNSSLKLPSGPTLYLATGDFTIEMWIYTTTATTAQQVFIRRASAAARGMQMSISGVTSQKLTFLAGDTNTAGWEVSLTGATSLANNTWYHAAVTRSGNTFTLWVNGVSDATASSSLTIADDTSLLLIGVNDASGAYLNGNIDDLRITKGYARYTANFTPQRSQWQDQ